MNGNKQASVIPQVWNKRDRHTPPDAVYVGRPTKWGNPFVIGKDGTRKQVISRYEDWVCAGIEVGDLNLAELRGKDLVCWCAPLACHGDVLLRLANAPPDQN